MTAAIVLVLIAIIVAGVILARQTSKTKKRAIAELEAERESVGTFDIFELVESEVSALGLEEIDGAADIPHGVLLKAWSDGEDVVSSCADRSDLRFVLADGVVPAKATDTDVKLECRKPKPTDNTRKADDDS